MLLSDTKIKTTKPSTKIITLNDGDGLLLEVRPVGSKLWRYRFTYDGKRTRLSLGNYPAVSLKAARTKRDEIKEMVASGIDPRIKEESTDTPPAKTFSQMVDLYLNHYREDRNEKYWEG